MIIVKNQGLCERFLEWETIFEEFFSDCKVTLMSWQTQAVLAFCVMSCLTKISFVYISV